MHYYHSARMQSHRQVRLTSNLLVHPYGKPQDLTAWSSRRLQNTPVLIPCNRTAGDALYPEADPKTRPTNSVGYMSRGR